MSGYNNAVLAIIITLFFSNLLFASQSKFSCEKLLDSDSLSIKQNSILETNTKIDRWISVDKGYHLIGSIISTTGISNSCIRFAEIEKNKSIQIGVGFTFAFGLGKEFWDGYHKNNIFSWKDLTADVLGILIGAALLQID